MSSNILVQSTMYNVPRNPIKFRNRPILQLFNLRIPPQSIFQFTSEAIFLNLKSAI